MQQLLIDVPVKRVDNDDYELSLVEYNNKDKRSGKVFLCFCEKMQKYYVSIYFSREFLESKKVKIIK